MDTARRRRNKTKQKQVQEVSADSETSDENSKKTAYNHGNERLLSENKQEEIGQHDVRRMENKRLFRVNFEVDLISIVLLFCGLATRMYRLEEPKNIVYVLRSNECEF